jgi:hypothetical protein
VQDVKIAARLDCSPDSVGRDDDGSAPSGRIVVGDRARSARPAPVPAADRRGQSYRARAAGHPWPDASRCRRAELHRLIIERGIADASAATIRRWLRDEAIKPWQQRS